MIGSFMHTTIVMMTPILLAALGGLFTDLSGMLNIGLEGMMLMSAFVSVYVANATGSLLMGVIAGVLSACLLAAIMAVFSLNLKANVFVVGLATNLMAAGMTVFLSGWLVGTRGTIVFHEAPRLSRIDIPLLGDIPVIGRMLTGYNVMDFLALGLTVACFFVIFKTSYGYHLRSVGMDYRTAESVGISVYKYRFVAFIISGVFAGLGGAALSLPLRAFVGGMTGGRGWIALVAVVLGRGNPFGVLIASLIFGAASAVSNTLQAVTEIPPKLLLAVPFVVTLVAMIIYAVRRNDSLEQR
jgi:simple sugar transport system permease protein